MEEKIKVLIVDDIEQTRQNVKRLIEFEDDLVVVGEASRGREAIEKCKQLKPHCILVDINMPDMDGIKVSEILSVEQPETTIVIMSVQGEQEYWRKAMSAGARDYLVKPFTGDELVNAIRRAYQVDNRVRILHSTANQEISQGRVACVYSAKGGVGKTTIAVNLAAYLAKYSHEKVVLVDLDLQFGDTAIMLDHPPKRTLYDLSREGPEVDEEVLESMIERHKTGLHLLASPRSPEEAELITPDFIKQVISHLKNRYDLVIVDTSPVLDEHVLAVLDQTDYIFMVITLDLPTLKNCRLCLELLDTLHFKNKVHLVANKIGDNPGLTTDIIQQKLDLPLLAELPYDPRRVAESVNKGIPFVLTQNKSKLTGGIRKIVEECLAEGTEEAEKPLGLLRFLASRSS